jgi:hypothetical protein
MGNSEIILIIIMALGFSIVIHKVNKAVEYISLCLSILAGKMITEALDDDTIALRMKDEDDE